MIVDFNSFQHFLRKQKLFERYGFSRIGVFGSFARGEQFRDVDLLIEERLEYDKRLELKKLLEEQLKVPVDIVVRDFAEPIILHRALKDIKYATKARK